MSGAPGPSSNKLAYWELEAEMEAREDPEFQPRDKEMEEAEETSSDDDEIMVDAEDATTTDGGGGATTSGGSASKKARKDRTRSWWTLPRGPSSRV